MTIRGDWGQGERGQCVSTNVVDTKEKRMIRHLPYTYVSLHAYAHPFNTKFQISFRTGFLSEILCNNIAFMIIELDFGLE